MKLYHGLRNLALRVGYHSGPDFIIVGAQKAGTSALYQMLRQHPLIQPSSTKEIHYFDNDAWYEKGQIHSYHKYFPLPHNKNRRGMTFEATPMYLYHPAVAERLFKYNPKLKIIISLREPSSRAFSAWTMYYHHIKNGANSYLKEFRTFDELVEREIADFGKGSFYTNPHGYIERGMYYDQICRYQEYFPKDQIYVVESQGISTDWENAQKEILKFLDLPLHPLPLLKVHEKRTDEIGKYTDALLTLKRFYAPHNKKLYELLNRDFGWNEF